MAKVFKKEVLDEIRRDLDLYTKVVKAMKVRPYYLPVALSRNSGTLNSYDVYEVVAAHKDCEINDLLEEVEKVA